MTLNIKGENYAFTFTQIFAVSFALPSVLKFQVSFPFRLQHFF